MVRVIERACGAEDKAHDRAGVMECLTLGSDGSLGSKDPGHVDSSYMIGSHGSLDQGGQFFSEIFQSAKHQWTIGIV